MTQRVVLAEFFTAVWEDDTARRAINIFMSRYDSTQFVCIAHHHETADPLGISEGKDRSRTYGIWSIPTIAFDGVLFEWSPSSVQGGINAFEKAYDDRAGIPPRVDISTVPVMYGNSSGEVRVSVRPLNLTGHEDLRVHIAIIEDDVLVDSVEYDQVSRLLLPTARGEAINLSENPNTELSYRFTADPSWRPDRLRCVAWVQYANYTPYEIPIGVTQFVSEVLQSTMENFTLLPNQPPVLSNGTARPMEACETTPVGFSVHFRDVDGGHPEYVRVHLRERSGHRTVLAMADAGPNVGWSEGHVFELEALLSPGLYGFRFLASDGFDTATGDVGWHEGLRITGEGTPFELASPGHSPGEGWPDTIFNFSILYRHETGRAPDEALVNVDGGWHELLMDNATGPGEWCVFSITLTLSLGSEHWYFFVFRLDGHTLRMPGGSLRYMGPVVQPRNEPPQLRDQGVTPSSGTRLDAFVFEVTCSDNDGDPPSSAVVRIDGEPYQMLTTGDDFTNGSVFRLTCGLGLGNHRYHFEFSDGLASVRLPLTGEFSGPVVNNLPPSAVISSPEADEVLTMEALIDFSSNGSGDPEGDEVSFEWRSDLDGMLSREPYFTGRLRQGSHRITLVVVDEHGARSEAQVDVTIAPAPTRIELSRLTFYRQSAVEGETIWISVLVTHLEGPPVSDESARFLVDGLEYGVMHYDLLVGAALELSFGWKAMLGEHMVSVRSMSTSVSGVVAVTPNHAPTVSVTVEEPRSEWTLGNALHFKAVAEDPEGHPINYSWQVDGADVNSTAQVLEHRFHAAGTYNVTVTATDELGMNSTVEIQVVITTVDVETGEDGALLWVLLSMTVVIVTIVTILYRHRRGASPPRGDAGHKR